MKMPLMAYASPKNVTVIYQKKVEYINPPFNPYFLAYKKNMETDMEKIWGTDFHTNQKLHVAKIPITDVQASRDHMSDLRAKGYGVEYNRPIEQIFIDSPEFFRSFPNGEPDVLCFDIEVYTDGSSIFPHYERSPIISIGVKYNDEDPIVFMDFKPGSDHPDRWILIEFLRFLKSKNPDIVVTYNGTRFDLPFIYERAKAAGIDVEQYSRIKKDWKFHGVYSIPGSIHYDLYYADIVKDQSMMGIKNRRLKTVAEWFKIDAIELDPEESANTSQLIGSNRLMDYNASDVEVSKSLYNIYHLNHMMMAEFLGVPLDHSINKYPSFAPKIVLARKLKQQGFIFLDNNEQRHPDITGKYEGAIVDIFKKGFIEKVWKLDVGSFYPSTMIAFNISPETCKIVKTEDFTGKWNYKMIDDVFWLRIPDRNLNKDIVVSIDQKTPGVLSTMLRDMKEERFQLKKKAKKAKTQAESGMYEAQSSALKVLMNAVYGSAALPETVYSDLSVAISTIAICRLIFSKILEKYKDCIVEADSVVGNTPIFVKKDDRIKILPINELMEMTEDDGAIIEKVSDNIRYNHLTNCYLETWTLSGWSRILYVYEHETEKPTFYVDTEGGFVECTKDHSLFSMNGHPTKPEELEIGKSIQHAKDIPDIDGRSSVSTSYAKALGYLCATGVVIEKDNNGPKMVLKDIDPKIVTPLFLAHQMTYTENVRTTKLLDIYDKNCICKTGPKVPGFIMTAEKKVVSAYLNGFKLANKRADKPALACATSEIAACIMFLIKRTGKNVKINWSDDRAHWVLQTTSKDVGCNVTGITKADPYRKKVYDLTTIDGTFSCAIGNILLHNTDGIYVDKPLDSNEIQEYVKDLVVSMIGKCDHPITIDRDNFGPGWFHRAKNYVLMDLITGNPIFHGVAFKSSSHPKIYDEILKKIALMILQGENVQSIWDQTRQLVDLTTKELKDFTMRTTIRSDPKTYANDNSLQSVLIKQAEKLGVTVEVGTQIEYIVTKGRTYTIASNVQDVSEIDYDYYATELDKAMELFGIKQIHQLSLF